MNNERLPLNGRKTHPLTDKSKAVLKRIAKSPVPCHEINPGIQDRLFRGMLVYIDQRKSPYKKHKGGTCDHLVITEAGIEACR